MVCVGVGALPDRLEGDAVGEQISALAVGGGGAQHVLEAATPHIRKMLEAA